MNTSFDFSSGPVPELPSIEQLDLYFTGDATATEVIIVERWLAQYPDSATAVESLRRMQKSGLATWNAETRWNEMAHRIGSVGSEAVAPQDANHQRQVSSAHSLWRLTIGSVLSVLLLAIGWVGINQRTAVTQKEAFSTYTAANAERVTVMLPDSTQVTLNVASRLDVPANFGRENRTVRLHGEALFAVKSRPGTPFIVRAGPSTTRVLGTTFVVRYYDTDTEAFVAVHDGKVAVGSSVVSAAQRAQVSTDGLVVVQPTQSVLPMLRGTLSIEGKVLPDAIVELNRWYDVDIRLGDPILRMRSVEGEFLPGSVSDLIETLEFTMAVRVVQQGRVLTIFPK